MMHCSRKLLGNEEEGYFIEKRPVNVRAKDTTHLAESLPAPEGCWRVTAITAVPSEWSATRNLSSDQTAKSL